MNYIEEELTIAEFAERFLNINDFETPMEYSIEDLGIEILGKNLETNNNEYKLIEYFIIKPSVDIHYTDGKIKCTANHKIIEDNKIISANKHPDFTPVNETILVTDFQIADNHNYYANTRLHHNTTSGGKAIGFHSSVRVRFKQAGQIKADIFGVDQVVGISTVAIIKKNRCGPPLRKAEFEIYFDRGVDDAGSWLKILKKYKLIKQAGAWYTIDLSEELNDSEYKFQSKDWNEMMQDERIKRKVKSLISSVMIIKPKETSELGIDDVLIDNQVTEDD